MPGLTFVGGWRSVGKLFFQGARGNEVLAAAHISSYVRGNTDFDDLQTAGERAPRKSTGGRL